MKIKLIIAREGLILLGLIIAGVLWYFLWDKAIPSLYANLSKSIAHSYAYLWNGSIEDIKSTADFAYYIWFIGYPLYLLIRFIIWAVRTLREK